MTGFDYTVAAVVGLSALIGLLRGAVREVFALAAWVAAFVLANAWGGAVEAKLVSAIENPMLRWVAAYAGLFVATLFALSVIGTLASKLVRTLGLGPLDRGLGSLVGLARGIVVVTILVLLAGFTAAPQQPFWTNAVTSPWFERIAGSIRPWLPVDPACSAGENSIRCRDREQRAVRHKIGVQALKPHAFKTSALSPTRFSVAPPTILQQRLQSHWTEH